MRSLLLIILSLTLLKIQAAWAQPADEFFNTGAHFYISNNIPQALESVEGGLKLYPNDVKLKKLEELLKQQSQQQQQQNQQQQNQQNQKNQQNQQNQQQSQPKQQQQQNQQAQNQSEQQKKQQQAQSSTGQSNEKQGGQNEQTQAMASNQMTPEEARRLLDAQKGNEQFLQLKPQGKPRNDQQPIKDW